MRTRILISVPLVALAALAPAQAAVTAPPAPALRVVATKLADLTAAPLVLPSILPLDYGGRVYTMAGPEGRGWSIALAATRNCGGANACTLGSLEATRSARRLGAGDGQRVRLITGQVGRYQPLSCGASCSPPSITFRFGAYVVEYQLKIAAGPKRERASMIAIANSALRAGPR
jgi:hypothetical protein